MADSMYDFCVVGAGMVGSAAAKWLTSLQSGTKICLIGPKEPTEEEWNSEEREIFSSHYDEGRLTREMDVDYIWALLAQRSIQRYRDIERESGVDFYQEVGCLYVGIRGSEYLQKTRENAMKMDLTSYRELNAAELCKKFPYLYAEEEWHFLFNFKNAGHVSPRKLVLAQQKIAASQGCEIIGEVVTEVRDSETTSENNFVQVICQSGQMIRAKRVLLCTGAFTNFHHLLPDGKQIDFSPTKTFVVKPEVSEEAAKKMADMPSVLSAIPGKVIYMLPPIKYPDGKYYLKIGKLDRSKEVCSLQEMSKWFKSQGENDKWKDAGLDIIKTFIPDFDPLSVKTSCCCSSHTPTGHLYCDMITSHLGSVMAMCGKGAKSSDEIGRMGALMIAKGSWDYDLSADYFKLKYKDGGD